MARHAWLPAFLVLLFACRDEAQAPIQIVAGARPSDRVTLFPRASLAEYIEISPGESTLLITLSSDSRSCDAHVESPVDALSLSVKVVFPAGGKAEPGNYAMLGDSADPQKPHALPTAKLGRERIEFPPGGSLQLEKLDLTHRGLVEGRMSFEFPGSAERAATRISGAFVAHFCRVNRLGVR